jgi:hypothetical protein
LDRALNPTDGARSFIRRRELACVIPDLVHEVHAIFRINNSIYQTESFALFEIKQFTSRHQFNCFGFANNARQTLSATGSRQNPQRDLRQPHLASIATRNPEIGRHCYFQSAADAMTINRGDHEFRCLLQTAKSLVRVQAEIVFEFRCYLAQHLDVCACAKEFFAAAGDYYHLDTFIHPRFENARIQLLHHLVGISICRRIVERQDRDTVFGSIIYELACMSGSCLSFSHCLQLR